MPPGPLWSYFLRPARTFHVRAGKSPFDMAKQLVFRLQPKFSMIHHPLSQGSETDHGKPEMGKSKGDADNGQTKRDSG